jgi:hypothetical protein
MIHIEKFRRVMEDISAERGEFVFFGLFLREEAPDTSDVVISAPWLEAGKLKALREFVLIRLRDIYAPFRAVENSTTHSFVGYQRLCGGGEHTLVFQDLTLQRALPLRNASIDRRHKEEITAFVAGIVDRRVLRDLFERVRRCHVGDPSRKLFMQSFSFQNIPIGVEHV